MWIVFSICATTGHTAEPAKSDDFSSWGRLLVLPFINMTAIHGEDASVRGPLSRQVFVTGEVASDADLFMNRMVERRLTKKAGLSWEAVSHETNPGSLAISTSKEAHLKAVSNQGRQRGADHVLAGYLYAYRQRDGGSYGVQTPAKVIFELVVIRVGTERVVRQQRFDETQQALSDNLLNLGKFIRRKGRWIRAHEMAEHAVQEMLDVILESRAE